MSEEQVSGQNEDGQSGQSGHREPPVNERGRAFDPDASSDERLWAMFQHLSLLGHMVLPGVAALIPFIMWQMKKEESAYIDDHGREAVNFHITLIIYSLGLPLLAAIIGVLTCGVGLVLLIPAAVGPYVLGLIGMVLAAQAANRGEFYRYPMTMRFV